MMGNFSEKISDGTHQALGLVGSWFNDHAVNILFILLFSWLLHRYGANLFKRIIARTVRPDLYPTKIDREKRVKTLESLTKAVVRVGVYLIAFVLIIGEINPSYTAALFASAGLVTVALGFGAKDLINDFITGMFIITENQYRVGDVVEIAGVSGTVEDVTVRTTILRDIDGNVHHVPNGDIGVSTNKTMGYSNINEDITLVADTDIDRLQHVIDHVGKQLAARADYEQSIKEAPHYSGIVGYGPTGVTVKIAGKVNAGDKWVVKSEFYKLLHGALAANHLELAGPLLVPHTATKKAPTPARTPRK